MDIAMPSVDSDRIHDAGGDAVLLAGCGNMGGALLTGWLSQGRGATSITVVDPRLPDVPAGVRLLAAAPGGPVPLDALVLAMKPQMLAQAAPAYAPLVGPGTLLLSILAAVEIDTLRRHFPAAGAIVRAVPNLPSAIGKGITALAGEGPPAMRALAGRLCAPLGAVEWLDGEAQIDAATSVSGCGPAFLFRFADAVASAGVAQGLSRAQALRLIAHTMAGAGAMLIADDTDPAALAQRVASPGGVTLAGLEVLDRDDALATLMAATLAAAAARNAEMARTARG
ncbi:pyrroline-5-carboxylate reductase [Sphingobium aquiterrae]|uniref:pyrroline-5-carboxylate reductase family protein n=1 Tax=Sphingobium aquiterrae TaxID=2038656 RepID=UPI003016EF8A